MALEKKALLPKSVYMDIIAVWLFLFQKKGGFKNIIKDYSVKVSTLFFCIASISNIRKVNLRMDRQTEGYILACSQGWGVRTGIFRQQKCLEPPNKLKGRRRVNMKNIFHEGG